MRIRTWRESKGGKMAVPKEREEDKEQEALLLWQRACFFEGTSPRSRADSLRLRGRHLHQLYNRTDSSSNDRSQLMHLLKFHLQQYSSVIDSQDKTKGLNNFADEIQSIIKSAPHSLNESRQWKSELTKDNIMTLPVLQQLIEKEKHEKVKDVNFHFSKDIPLIPPIPSPKPHPQQATPTNPQPSSNKSHDNHMTSKTVKHTTFQYQVPNSVPDSPLESPPNNSKYKKGRGYYRGKGRGYFRGQKRLRESDESEEEEETGKGRGQDFVTAKDQYIINQKKKFGGRKEVGGARGGASTDSADTNIDLSSYGSNKKSLGTRRAPGTKFVPPVKKDESTTESLTNNVVMYNNGKGSSTNGGGSGLPPELEGNELLKNVEPRMVELIMNEIMDHGSPVGWDDIAGLKFAKDTIKEIVVWPMLRPDIFKGLRGPPRGILLFGPPGTGKTLIGRCIASQVKATFFSISASSLTSKWVGEGEKMVRALFSVARCYQPAVVFIDEIDSLLSQRSDTEHESSRRIKTEFLVQLDGATTNAEDRLLLIGATNRPQEIDEAARRRLVKRLYIPLPDAVARKEIVLNLLKEQPFSLSEEEIVKLCEKSDGYSGADMANLCREAALGPIRDAAHNIQHISADDVRLVKYSDFEEAFHNIRPSVSEKDLELYIDWNQRYGCSNVRQ